MSAKTGADKAAALASYATQANDDELVKIATRIQLRTFGRKRRIRETLKGRVPTSWHCFLHEARCRVSAGTRPYLVEEDGRCFQYRQYPGELTPAIEVPQPIRNISANTFRFWSERPIFFASPHGIMAQSLAPKEHDKELLIGSDTEFGK
jgi:hypothetical protein